MNTNQKSFSGGLHIDAPRGCGKGGIEGTEMINSGMQLQKHKRWRIREEKTRGQE